MSFGKITVVVGRKIHFPADWDAFNTQERFAWIEANPSISTHRRGYWKADSLKRLAVKMGLVGEVRCTHHVMDYLGKGRGAVAHEIKIEI